MINIKNKFYNLLKWSEKYTKTDMVYFTKGGFWLFLGLIITSVCTFLLSIAFANLLPKDVYGNYKYILSIFAILGIFSLPGINKAIIQAVARGFDGSYLHSFKAKLKWSLLGSLIAIGLGIYYWMQGNANLPIPLFLSALFLPLMSSSELYISFLSGKKLFAYQTKYSVITKILSVGSMVAALFLTHSLSWIIAVYLISNTLTNFFFFLITKKKFLINKNDDSGTLNYGKHLSLINIIVVISSNIDSLLTFHLIGVIGLATYSFATAPIEQIRAAFNLVNQLTLPKFAQRNSQEIKAGMKNKFSRLFLVSALVVITYVWLAPYIYQIFFPKYLNSVFYSQIYAFFLLNFTISPALNVLEAKRKIKEQYISNIINSVSRIILMTLFIIWQGLLGLVIAKIISHYLGSLLNLYFYYKSSEENDKKF